MNKKHSFSLTVSNKQQASVIQAIIESAQSMPINLKEAKNSRKK